MAARPGADSIFPPCFLSHASTERGQNTRREPKGCAKLLLVSSGTVISLSRCAPRVALIKERNTTWNLQSPNLAALILPCRVNRYHWTSHVEIESDVKRRGNPNCINSGEVRRPRCFILDGRSRRSVRVSSSAGSIPNRH